MGPRGDDRIDGTGRDEANVCTRGRRSDNLTVGIGRHCYNMGLMCGMGRRGRIPSGSTWSSCSSGCCACYSIDRQVHIQASQDNTAANGNIICSLADQNEDKLMPSPYVMKDEDASRFRTCVFAD